MHSDRQGLHSLAGGSKLSRRDMKGKKETRLCHGLHLLQSLRIALRAVEHHSLQTLLCQTNIKSPGFGVLFITLINE